jgi:hypothetical protein
MGYTQRTLLLVCILIKVVPVSDVQALSAKDVYAKTAENVVTIECWNNSYIKTKQGSGIVLGRLSEKHGVDILTNYHVVNFSSLIRITTKAGESFNANVLYFDALTDAALIRVATSAYQPANLPIARDISVGDIVYAVGAPKGLGWTITSGIISGIRNDHGIKLVQTNASISSGSSGGGLFNDSGELVGMTSFYLKEAQNLNFAVAVSPDFLSAFKGFREQEAGVTEDVPDDFWFIGHYEPGDDLAKTSSPALKRWATYSKELEGLAREQNNSWHGNDFTAYDKMDVKMSKLLAQRYSEFPNDVVGFLAHVELLTDRRAKIKELLIAADKWPSDFAVIQALFWTLNGDTNLPLEVVLGPLTTFTDALPSVAEVEKLSGYQFAPARYRVETVVDRLGVILNIIDHTLRGNREREKTAAIRAVLDEKGWKAKRKKLGN